MIKSMALFVLVVIGGMVLVAQATAQDQAWRIDSDTPRSLG